MAIHGNKQIVDVELTVTLDAYTAGDVVGGLLEIEAHSAGGGGVLRRLVVIDEDSQAEAYTLYLFNAEPSTIADAAAFAPTVADLRKLIGTVAIAAASYVTVNAFDYLVAEVDLEYTAPSGQMWGYLVATDTPDYTNADTLMLRFVLDKD